MQSPGDDAGSTVQACARNNAEWCDILCGTHGVPGEFHADAWVNARRTPPYYPDAVTLDGSAVGERILARVDTSPGCSVKDSFASLDLSSAGFRVLFEAEWIHRTPRRRTLGGTALGWSRVCEDAALIAWGAAWGDGEVLTGLFRPALLHHPAVAVLGGYAGDQILAGAIVNRTGPVLGVSNLFTTLGDLDDAWTGCLAILERLFPRSPVVGYESGDALVAAHRQDFTSVGPLRVWLKDR
jgi:hypothetical protein